MADTAFMEKLTALCKRRGFIFQSSEIYGGIGGFWDYGPLGVELKRNIKDQWWRDMIANPPTGPDGSEMSMVGVDCSIIMNPKVWEASGHATGFADPMVDCKECKKRFRADKVWFTFVYDKKSAERLNLALAGLDFGSFGNDEELAKAKCDAVRDAIRRDSKTIMTEPTLVIPVEADGEEQACLVELSKRQQKALDGGIDVIIAFPATQWESLSAVPKLCPDCAGELTPPRSFNLMFETFVGALQDDSSKAFLRPETAQGIFANFKNVLDTSRVKLPFGIGQVGKSFRNEINPRNYTFRSREFEQMEIEFFCADADAMDWYKFWRDTRFQWYVDLGLASDKLRLRDQTGDELAHYSNACADIEYLFPFADDFQELEGVAHRGCYDLTQHQKHSGKDLTYFDEEAWSKFLADRKERGEPELSKDEKKKLGSEPPYRFVPTVIEPSAGADRATLAFLCEAYTEDEAPDDKGKMQKRTLMKFHPKLAPLKAAIFPLVNKEGMPDIAHKLYRDLKAHMPVTYDDGGAIGRRYRRQDEIGTPYCITVDGDTLSDQTVTIRDRDSLAQERVALDKVGEWLGAKIRG